RERRPNGARWEKAERGGRREPERETTENTSGSYELQRKTVDYVCLTLPGPPAHLLRHGFHSYPTSRRRLYVRRRANALPKAPELCLSTKSKLRLRGDVRRFVRIRWSPLGESIPLFRLPRLMESILGGQNPLLHQRRQGPTDLRRDSLVRTFKELENRLERKDRGRFFINNAAEFEMVTKTIA
ncbi:hypothetical protein ALC60_07774, partial [Trachymyrmex zeteki]